jgi:hypothetical protein
MHEECGSPGNLVTKRTNARSLHVTCRSMSGRWTQDHICIFDQIQLIAQPEIHLDSTKNNW